MVLDAAEHLAHEMLGRILWALVVHEVVTPAEFAGAQLALERLLTFVDEHVGLELVRVGEAGRAQLAGVGPLPRVDAQVTAKVGNLNKATQFKSNVIRDLQKREICTTNLYELSIAVGAVVGLLPSVEPHVRLEVVVAGEALAALLALERLFPRVRPLVVLEDVLVAKGPVAYGAAEHLSA